MVFIENAIRKLLYMKLYMSNKSKNVGTVAKAKKYLQSVHPFSNDGVGLAQCSFRSLHFTVVCVCVSCRSVAVCLQQCYDIRIYIYIYIDYVVWCGRTKLALRNNR